MLPFPHSPQTPNYATVFVVSETGIITKRYAHEPISPAPRTMNHATPQSVNTTSIEEVQEPLHSSLKDVAVLQATLEPKATSPQKQDTPQDPAEFDIEMLRTLSGELDDWMDSNAAASQSQETPQITEFSDSTLRTLRGKLEIFLESILEREASAPQTQDTLENAQSDTIRAFLAELDIFANWHLESQSPAAQKQNAPKDRDSNICVLFGAYLWALSTCYVASECAGSPYPFTVSCLAVAWLSVLGHAISIHM